MMPWPDMVATLPDIDLDLPGIHGKLLQGDGRQVVFFDLDVTGIVPTHAHSAQWGVVIEGEMDLTIDGVTRLYRAGDSYTIPAGATHSATFRTHTRAIDVFDDPARYRARGAR